MPYIPRPNPSFLDGMQKHVIVKGRQVYKRNDRYYSWDEFHGEIEVFNRQGFHLMVLDPQGNKIKDAVRGRRIEV